jgi:hypothetical protein
MLVFDLECDGLLDEVTQIHCLVIYDTETDTTHTYNDQGNQEAIVRGIQTLTDADCICGHNIIGFDIAVILKLYPWFTYKQAIDTLLLSRLIHSNMMTVDKKRNWKQMPLQLYGRHSLESYGYRLGAYKGNFGKTADWQNWSQEMEDYCVQDVEVTKKLVRHFDKKLNELT